MVTKMYSERSRTKLITILAVVTLLSMGSVQAGVWWEDGHLEINDGDVYDGELFMIDYGSVDMFGGIVGKLETWDYSTGNIYGGHIDWLFTKDSSIVHIHGGTLDWLGAFQDSAVYLYAYDVTYHLTGGLEDRPWLEGTYYRNDIPFSFTLYDEYSYSHLAIVPEPATLLILGIGSLIIRKRE